MKFIFFKTNQKLFLVQAVMFTFSILTCFSSLKAQEVNIGDKISFSISPGIYSVSAIEFAYYNGRKISQLDWKRSNTPVVKFDFNYMINQTFTLNFKAWTSFGKSSSYMDDYDWEDKYQASPNKHSWHPNTSLDYANEFDFNTKGFFIKNDNYKLNALVGFQVNNFRWTGIGGDYSYDNGRDTGKFEDIDQIYYEQTFMVLYLGLGAQYIVSDFVLDAQFKYTPFAIGQDKDDHIVRNRTFSSDLNLGSYYGFTLNASYKITKNIKATSDFIYNNFAENSGNTTHSVMSTQEEIAYTPGGSKFTNSGFGIFMGLSYTFN